MAKNKKKKTKVKRDRLEIEGVVIEACPAGMFRVAFGDDKRTVVICTLSGKMRQFFIKVVLGDVVLVELSEYDTTKGRITKRLNG